MTTRFTVPAFLRDRLPHIVVAAVCVVVVYAVARLQGVNGQGSVLICAVVATCAVLALAMDYLRRRRFYEQLCETACSITDACAASSFLDEPDFLEGKIALDAIDAVSRTASGQIGASERDAADYRRYIEGWIHEVKTPIAASKLVLSGMHGEKADSLSRELERIEGQVETALFYARSTSLAGDYAISKARLADMCREACKRNSRFLIASGCIPAVQVPDDVEVLADKQWVVFMLSQLLVNSAKYGATRVAFTCSVEGQGTANEHTVLQVADDGCGIASEDVPRVFDMGFVGSNGRRGGKATGIGLFLVARLSESMGISVAIASEVGVGTRVIFEFPHDMRRLQNG